MDRDKPLLRLPPMNRGLNDQGYTSLIHMVQCRRATIVNVWYEIVFGMLEDDYYAEEGKWERKCGVRCQVSDVFEVITNRLRFWKKWSQKVKIKYCKLEMEKRNKSNIPIFFIYGSWKCLHSLWHRSRRCHSHWKVSQKPLPSESIHLSKPIIREQQQQNELIMVALKNDGWRFPTKRVYQPYLGDLLRWFDFVD